MFACVEPQVVLVVAAVEKRPAYLSADLEVEMFLVVMVVSLVVLWLIVEAVTEKKGP